VDVRLGKYQFRYTDAEILEGGVDHVKEMWNNTIAADTPLNKDENIPERPLRLVPNVIIHLEERANLFVLARRKVVDDTVHITYGDRTVAPVRPLKGRLAERARDELHRLTPKAEDEFKDVFAGWCQSEDLCDSDREETLAIARLVFYGIPF